MLGHHVAQVVGHSEGDASRILPKPPIVAKIPSATYLKVSVVIDAGTAAEHRAQSFIAFSATGPDCQATVYPPREECPGKVIIDDVEAAHAVSVHVSIQSMLRHWPLFTFLQVGFAFFLWFFCWAWFGMDLAGLESLWPRQTDLMVQEDCQDHRGEVWRFLTYQYTHVGANHAIMNSVMALVLGVYLEMVHGTLCVSAVFNLGVFGGACCYLVADNHERVVGMSGGCYGLLGMCLGDAAVRLLARTDARWQLGLPAATLAIELLNAFLFPSAGTSHTVHFGGFVAGFLAYIAMSQEMAVDTHHQRAVRWAAIFLALFLCTFSMTWGHFSDVPQDIFERVPWCWDRQLVHRELFGDARPRCIRCDSLDCVATWSRLRDLRPVSVSQCDKFGGWAVTER